MQIGHDELDVRWRAKPSQLNASLDEIFIVALVPNQLFCRRGLSQKPELYLHNRKEECYESLSIVRLGIAEELREQSVVARIKRTVEITRWKRHISDSNRLSHRRSKRRPSSESVQLSFSEHELQALAGARYTETRRSRSEFN